MSVKLYLSILLFCFSTSITPGPNNLMIMISGVNFGVKKSLPHYFGICLGFALVLFAVGLGANTIFDLYPKLALILKGFGVTYILYLASKTAFSSTKITMSASKSPLNFRQAVLFQWVNPKVWMMATGVYAAFRLHDANIFLQTMQITSAYILIAGPCIATWLIGGVMLTRVLNNEQYMRRFNYTMGILLIISILLMLV